MGDEPDEEPQQQQIIQKLIWCSWKNNSSRSWKFKKKDSKIKINWWTAKFKYEKGVFAKIINNTGNK